MALDFSILKDYRKQHIKSESFLYKLLVWLFVIDLKYVVVDYNDLKDNQYIQYEEKWNWFNPISWVCFLIIVLLNCIFGAYDHVKQSKNVFKKYKGSLTRVRTEHFTNIKTSATKEEWEEIKEVMGGDNSYTG